MNRRHYSIAFCNNFDNNTFEIAEGKKYTIIPNKIGYWSADPFLLEYNSCIYIFAELWSYLNEKGVIDYCKWNGKHFSKWKIALEEEYHLSYPNLFQYNGKIYMCPESSANNTIDIYICLKFPDCWEKISSLYSGKKCVDTTFLQHNNNWYAFTYVIGKKEQLYLCNIINGKIDLDNGTIVNTDDTAARPGGKFFVTRTKELYRVSQKHIHNYGEGFYINEVFFDGINYKEHIIAEYTQKNFLLSKKIKEITGVHTFNYLNNFSVIDIQYERIDIIAILIKIWNRLKHVWKQ